MNKETILVIDDNRQIANLLARELLPGLGYEALVAYNGKSALEIIRSTPLSLILTDLELPDTNGLELLRQFNSEGYNIPTILITAHGSEEIAVDAFRLGVQDYLIKPVDVDKLDEAITRALSETRLRRETTMLSC
jgi:two-component system NtrC family sensor kinase